MWRSGSPRRAIRMEMATVSGKMGLAVSEGGAVKANDAAAQEDVNKVGETLPRATYFSNAKTHNSTGCSPCKIVDCRPPI